MSALPTPQETSLVNVQTGEFLPATTHNAALALQAAREMKRRLDTVIHDATEFLLAESRAQGTKTFHTDHGTLELAGGPVTEYDPTDLIRALRGAGCPEDRVREAVETVVSYKVNRSVLRQLAGANPEYRAAIETAERLVEKPYRASVKP